MISSPPAWALALTFWLHLLATVTWVGSLASISFLILPAMQRALDPETQLIFIEAMQKRLEPIAWFSMSLLVLTGLFQMSVNPHYDGFLSISTQWSLAILTKHLLGIIMVVVSAIQTWEVIPAIRRAIVKSKKSKNAEELNVLRRREILLLRMNFGLSVLILLATAFARFLPHGIKAAPCDISDLQSNDRVPISDQNSPPLYRDGPFP
jgi:uncharacterized membrane protein